MKPKHRKIVDACRAMKSFGITPAKTKTALKGLLTMYENNWELIEDENYRVLFDVLMPEEERVEPKGKETLILEPKKRSLGMTSSHKEAPSCVKTEVVELPITGQEEQHAFTLYKSCLDSTPSRRAHQNDSGASQPLLRRTRLRCQEEAFIRESKEVKSKNKEAPPYDDTEVVKLPAKRLYTRQQKKQALSLSKSRRVHQSDDDLFSDSEEAQPLLKRSCLRGQEEKPLICDAKGVIYNNCKSPSNGKTEAVELRRQKKQAPFLAKSCMETTPSTMALQNDGDLFSDSEESEDSPLLSRRYRGRNQKEDILVFGNPPPAQSPIVICLDTSSDSDGCNVDEDRAEELDVEQLIVDNTNCISDLSQMDDDADSVDLLEVEPLIMDNRGCVLDSSLVDVASSPLKGQVSVSLTCNSAPQSDFHLPNIQVVEERCIKLKENGECFLSTGTDSIVDKSARFRDVPQLKKSNSQNFLAIKDDYQANNCSALSFPYQEFVFQNLIKIVPHIPRHIDFCRFECLHSLIGFPIKDIEDIYSKIGKGLKVLQGLQSSKICKVEAARNYRYSHGVVKPCVYVEDITRGEERVKIPLEDGRNAEDLSTFFYIPQNVVYKNAYVNFSLGCISDQACCSNCYGNCLASLVPCACAIQTGGGFAYTPGGLVKDTFLEEYFPLNQEPKEHHYFYCKKCPLERFRNKKSSKPCKGHLLRKFIKECWCKCGCKKNCGNRIVQQGISAKLQLFLTPEGKGWGLRTLQDFPRGAFVCEYVGEIVTSRELRDRIMQGVGKRQTYPVLLDAYWGSKGVLKDEEALCLDATVYGNVARFINHRCSDATLIQIPVEVESPDHHYYHLALFTTRNVAAMEELTWDYGIDFDDHDHPVKPFQCVCGSAFCRGSDFKVQA